jgi:hypothetical protein
MRAPAYIAEPAGSRIRRCVNWQFAQAGCYSRQHLWHGNVAAARVRSTSKQQSQAVRLGCISLRSVLMAANELNIY